MNKLPTALPFSDLQNDRNNVLAMLAEQPLILTQSGEACAALVSIEQWNHLMNVFEMYRAYWRAESARVQNEMADQTWIDADGMIDEWAAKHGSVAVSA